MRLKLIKNGNINENGENRSVNTFALPGQGLVTPDSFDMANLTGSTDIDTCHDMSFPLLAAAFKLSGLSLHEYVVLLSLADSANKDTNDCFILMQTLADKSHLCKSATRKAVASLEAKKIIERRKRPGRSSFYYVNLGTPQYGAPPATIECHNLSFNQREENQVCLIDGHTINCTHKKGVRFEGIRKSRRAKQ